LEGFNLVSKIPTTSLDSPEFAVPEQYLIPVNQYPASLMEIPASRMFELKQALVKYKEKAGADAPIYDASQGDGGASLPGVPVEVLERAHRLQVEHGTAYDKPYGTDLFRQVSAEQYWNLNPATGWGPENIAFVQGGRDGLLKAYNAIIALGNRQIGDLLVVTRVPWVSYVWGLYGVGLNVLRAPGRPEEGWRFTPDTIKACAEFAAQHGRKPAGLLITSPDNPTGYTMPAEEQAALARTALENGYPFVLFDWMYHWVTDSGPTDINTVLKDFTPEQRDRLIFIDGLTKSLGGSNVRSAQVVASKRVIKHITSHASHGIIPSFYAQAVAIAAYEMGFEKAAAPIIEPTRQSRQILRKALKESGLPHIMGDGYYAFVDLTRYLEASSFEDSGDLGAWLGETFGVTVVPGTHFSEAGANWIRFSYALPPEKTEKAFQRLMEGLSTLV
jgi:aspartate aminotransferase